MKCVKCKDTGIVKFKYLVDKPLDPYCECEIGQKKKMWKSLIDGQKELQKAIIDAEPLPKYVCGLDFSKSESETLYGYFGNMQTPISVRKMEKIFKETIAAWKKFESECEKMEKISGIKDHLIKTPPPIKIKQPPEPPECRTVNNLGRQPTNKKLRKRITALNERIKNDMDNFNDELREKDNRIAKLEKDAESLMIQNLKYCQEKFYNLEAEPVKDFNYPCLVKAKDFSGLTVYAERSVRKHAFEGISLVDTDGLNDNGMTYERGEIINHWSKSAFYEVK